MKDAEIEAMKKIGKTLEGLDVRQRARALAYMVDKFVGRAAAEPLWEHARRVGPGEEKP